MANGTGMADGTHLSAGTKPRPLDVLIVGAGIGGLTAAIALRQQGHNVRIFERSKLAQETGAAIHLASNANGLLRRLGLRAEKIGGVEVQCVREFIPHTGDVKYNIDTTKVAKMWQHPWHLVHRAQLHTTLKEMAVDEQGAGRPAQLHVASKVDGVDAERGTITLDDGTVFQGDLIIGADGVHSRTRSSIPGGDKKPFDSGKSAFRFLMPTEVLTSDPKTAGTVPDRATLTMWIAENRRLVMYPCDGNRSQNFVAIHPTEESEADISEGADWQETGSKARMLQIYSKFEPAARAILEQVDESKIKVWKLLDMERMPSFVHGKLAVMGDAAHPFLPHQGQGGGQAIEDAAALAALLPLGTTPEDLPERLQIYEQCRYERAHKIQDFTRTAGMDTAELAAKGMKLDMNEYQGYNFNHDAWDYASNKLRKHLESKDPSLRYRTPMGFGPSPGPRRPLGLLAASEDVQALRKSTPERSTTYSIKFRTSRTFLENILPSGFAFTGPATAVSASIICTTLDGMTWLGGGGYSHCGLYLHGVNCTKRDGSKVFGTYLSVLLENLTDPIVTGRSELGMPKLFSDITVKETDGGSGCNISLGWRGTEYGNFSISKLAREEPTVNGNVDAPPQRGPGPPPPPPEQGLLLYRYVPAVGEPGKVDAEYPVLVPKPETDLEATPPETFASKTASIDFQARDLQSLPTLHYIAKVLAEIPVYEIEEAKLVKAVGVSDIGTAHRIE